MQKKQWLGSLGWLIIVVVAFWGGWLTAPEKVRVEKVAGPERIIYKLNETSIGAIRAYLDVLGYEVNVKMWVEKAKEDLHLVWQEGYKEGVRKGCR